MLTLYQNYYQALKRFLKFFWIGSTILLVIVYTLSCFTPIISPAKFALMGFLGLAFPILFLALVVTLLIWLWANRRIAFLLILILCLGYKNISTLFAWNKAATFSMQKAAGNIRILGYNVRGFDTKDKRLGLSNGYRSKMLDYIKSQQADIICIQDFSEFHDSIFPSNTHYLTDTLGYPYYYIAGDYKESTPWGETESGIALFSKIPLHNIQHLSYPGKHVPESMILADVTVDGRTKRLIVTHLQSMHLKKIDPKEKEPWQSNQDSAIIYSKSVVKKLDFFIPYHAQQSEFVRKQIDESPYPVIFSADMNEVPTSYAYNRIKGNLHDVFLMKGRGLGQTYYRISPTLRIDYFLVSPSVKVVQYKKDDIFMSDHYPQVMDIEW